jgi:hypothetical protein
MCDLFADGLAAKRSHIPFPAASGRNDEEWFAAATLVELCRRPGVPPEKKQEWADKAAGLVLYYAAIIFKRFATPDFENELNPVERELIKFFFIFNPSLAGSAKIRRLEVTPDPKPENKSTPTERHLHFPFGFAILAKTKRPEDAEPRRRLVYFRVQDHVRRMGLARNALVEMISINNLLEADLRKMHPDAHEIPTDRDRARFMQLFDSVKNTTLQKKNVPATEQV